MATVPSLGRADASPALAVSRLYEDHYDRVYGYCLYRLGSREEAEDAAQQTFLYALRGLERGIVPESEAGWIFAIAKNVCLARYRSRGRRGRLEVLSDPQALADTSPSPDDGGDGRLRLEEALARIPEQQRRAIVLREWRGLSYREIAEALGVSVPAVETLIFRARRSLAEILREEEGARPQRLRALDLGSLAAAAKSLLAGASAAKLAAGAAAVLAVVAAVPSSEPAPEPARSIRSTAPGPALRPAVATDRPVARPLPARSPDRRGTAAAATPRSKAKARPAPAASDSAPTPREAPAGGDPGLLETATGAVENVADETGAPVDVDVPDVSLPEVPLPEAEAPSLPVPPVGEVVEDATGALPSAPPVLP